MTRVAATMILALVTHQAMAQAAGQPPVTWSGVMRCGIIPGLTTLPLRQEIAVRVLNGQASYQREVHKADSSGDSGYTEQGTGNVGADGRVTITGGAIGRGFQMTATFQGVLPPGGGATRLAGTKLWTTRRTNQVSQDCSMELHR